MDDEAAHGAERQDSEDIRHAVTRDRSHRDGATAPDTLQFLRHAQTKSGRSAMELVREYFRLNRGHGKLTLREYVQYGVYDAARYSSAEQARFITNDLHWPITHACCDMTWQATTEDKWLCSRILAGSGVPTPETLAVIDTSDRSYPGTQKISTVAQLRDFMTQPNVLPLFGKENRGICSYGAFLAQDADAHGISLKGESRIAYDSCMERFVSDTPYLLQRPVTNHGFFARYADSLATIRVCILVTNDGVRTPFAILKLPSRKNVADSFWRPGNLACKLDVENGKILTARTQNPLGTEDHTAHPETGAPLLGEVVPMWNRVLDLVQRCSPIFQPVRYQSMDIAVTEDGPVLIEINTGGGFDLPQLASGDGFLTDEVREFFKTCGYRKL